MTVISLLGALNEPSYRRTILCLIAGPQNPPAAVQDRLIRTMSNMGVQVVALVALLGALRLPAEVPVGLVAEAAGKTGASLMLARVLEIQENASGAQPSGKTLRRTGTIADGESNQRLAPVVNQPRSVPEVQSVVVLGAVERSLEAAAGELQTVAVLLYLDRHMQGGRLGIADRQRLRGVAVVVAVVLVAVAEN